MTRYETYVFALCLIVFVLLVSTFSIMLSIIMKQRLKLVRGGLEDEALKIEYTEQKKRSGRLELCGNVVSLVLCFAFIVFFAFSLFVNLRENTYFEKIPTIRIVNSGSMSRKNPKNEYLTAYGLDNQFQTFDLVLVYKKPSEAELKLYDIIVYESNDSQIIHRIVGIEEPNEKHPNERYFLCRGDAIEQNDYFPVYYSQIKAIYRNERVPFVGSFVLFMQSPAGWMCTALIAFGVIGIPFLEKKLEKEYLARLRLIGFIQDEIAEPEGEALDVVPEAIVTSATIERNTNMVEVVDVVWEEHNGKNKSYRYAPNGLEVGKGDVVLVPTFVSEKHGEIVRKATVGSDIYLVDPAELKFKLKPILQVVEKAEPLSEF